MIFCLRQSWSCGRVSSKYIHFEYSSVTLALVLVTLGHSQLCPTGTNIEGSPCYAVHDKSSCFPFKWFEEGDKVEFLLTSCLRQIVVSAILKTWGTHALVALFCNPFSSWYKHSKRTHTMHMRLFSGYDSSSLAPGMGSIFPELENQNLNSKDILCWK